MFNESVLFPPITARPSPRSGPPQQHQHHRPESQRGEHQDEGGGAGDPGRGLPRARGTQEGPGGHAALPEIRLGENTLPGK